MTTLRTSNFIPDLDPYLDAQADDSDKAPEIVCQVCRTRQLTISKLVRPFTLMEEGLTGLVEHFEHLTKVSFYALGFEQTVVFPCGHVFGDRCIQAKFSDKKDLACLSCGFHMTYTSCGHAIAPAFVLVKGNVCIRDTFPLTIPEGGQAPRHCKQCRWSSIQTRLRYTLNSECVICAQRARSGVPQDPIEHDVHQVRHIRYGLKEAMGEIMMLVQPDFITRETETSAQKKIEDGDRRDVSAALLNAMVLTELEDTIWHRTATKKLTKDQTRRHTLGVQSIESCILVWLMDFEKHCRRMW